MQTEKTKKKEKEENSKNSENHKPTSRPRNRLASSYRGELPAALQVAENTAFMHAQQYEFNQLDEEPARATKGISVAFLGGQARKRYVLISLVRESPPESHRENVPLELRQSDVDGVAHGRG